MAPGLTLDILPYPLAVCRLSPDHKLPDWLWWLPFASVTRTGNELSLVIPQAHVPEGWVAARDWAGLAVRGPLDFALIGVLAALSGTLAEAGISLFALSTYDTDYILVRQADLKRTVLALTQQGHQVCPPAAGGYTGIPFNEETT